MLNILGQDEVKQFLENRLSNLPPTLLFCGPEGVGKVSAARELSRVLSLPIFEFYPEDDESFKVKQIRDLLKLYKENTSAIFLVSEVDKLKGQAASLLLKSLEDPKPGVHFILTAKEYAQVSYTVYSRCVMLEFNALTEESIRDYLQSKYNVWNDHFAKIANGSLKIADEVAAGSFLDTRNVVWSFLSEIKYITEDNLNVPEALTENPIEFISIGLNLLYDVIKISKDQYDLVVNTDLVDEYRNWLDRYSFDFAVFAIICFRDILKNLNSFYNVHLHLKTLILKLKLGSVPI